MSFVVVSCSKNNSLDQLPIQSATKANDAAKHCNCPTNSLLTQATGTAVSQNAITGTLTNLNVEIFYSSPSAAGSFKVVLKDKNGLKLESRKDDIYAVTQTPADGTLGYFVINYHVLNNRFPLTITKIDGATNIANCSTITHYPQTPLGISLH